MTVLNLTFIVGQIVVFIIILGLISGAIKSPFKKAAPNPYPPLETSDNSDAEILLYEPYIPLMMTRVPAEGEAPKSDTVNIVYDPESNTAHIVYDPESVVVEYEALKANTDDKVYDSETDVYTEEFPMIIPPALRGCYLEKAPVEVESEALKSDTADIVYDPKSDFIYNGYPITQEEWQKVMGDNPSYFKGADLPVKEEDLPEGQRIKKKQGLKKPGKKKV